MNGFADHGLDEDAFGEKKGNFVQAFDAFPKAKPQYVTRTSGGGKWTVAILIVSVLLILSECQRWWRGYETHTFAVEKGVGRDLQINLDIVIMMQCADIHINVQDAAGDRILAAQMLKKDPTNWRQWVDNRGMHRLGKDKNGKVDTGAGYEDEGFGEEHVHDIIASTRKQKFRKTPRLRMGPPGGDSCRIFGSLGVNKVQGDFHITARGHGYQEFGAHLDHTAFNFSHIISELSFGAFYPSLLNPLDETYAESPSHFQKFQYFLSIVPTVYHVESSTPLSLSSPTIFTNQYAVTSQNLIVGERNVPGIFFKYDIEPLLLTVEESRESFLRFCVKIINVFSGVLVAGGWGLRLTEWAIEVLGKRRRRISEGLLTNEKPYEED